MSVTTKPYLIRAIHEWCGDQGLTPYLAVTVDEFTRVPREFVRDGQIVLNVGLDATNQLHIGNDQVTFQARFGGKAFPVVVPIARVSAIYARENGQGMAFEVEATPAPTADTASPAPALDADDRADESAADEQSPSPADGKPPRRGHLTVVK